MRDNLHSKDIFIKSFKNLMQIKSVDKITATDIINESKLSRQTFYKYFYNIEDLIYAIHIDNISATYNILNKLNYNRFSLTLTLELMLKNKNFYKKIMNSNYKDTFVNMFISRTKEYTIKYIFLGNDKLHTDKDIISYLNFHIYGSTYTILNWLGEKNPSSAEYLSNVINSSMPEKLRELLPKDINKSTD